MTVGRYVREGASRVGYFDSFSRSRLTPGLQCLAGSASDRTLGGRELAQRLWDPPVAAPWVAATQATEVIQQRLHYYCQPKSSSKNTLFVFLL